MYTSDVIFWYDEHLYNPNMCTKFHVIRVCDSLYTNVCSIERSTYRVPFTTNDYVVIRSLDKSKLVYIVHSYANT